MPTSPPVIPRNDERQAARLGLACSLVALLAACAQPGPGSSAAGAGASARPAPSAAPEPAASAPAAAMPEPAVAYSPATSQRLTSTAVELLEQGKAEEASAELRRALQADPSNRLAQSLVRQIEGDPVALLGRESFPYRVQPGESLSRIAQRFLGDVHQFYILARYNDIPVPRQLQGGQMLRIPGKAPPPGSLAPAAAAPSPTPAPAPAAPAAAAPPPPAPMPTPAEAPRSGEAERQANIAAATRAARAAFARQDLDTAIRHWDQVLDLEPQNPTAQLERRRAVELRERLRKVR